MRRFILALAVSAFSPPAWAAPVPDLIPTHDVTGNYIVTGQAGAKIMTVEYSKSANVLRISPHDGPGYILYDFTARDAKMVLPQMQRYMDQPRMASQAQALTGGATGHDVSFTKGSTETIAGHSCTDYTATDKTRGTSSTICVTPDGVLLKITSAHGNAVAQTISYAAVPVADVQVPPGYTQFTMPKIPAGMSGLPAPSGAGP